MATVLEDLPLIRGKAPGIYNETGTGPEVGPGSYNPEYNHYVLHSHAPFNSTSQRKPLLEVDPVVPGPGAYTLPDTQMGLGVGSCPFLSDAVRFSNGIEEKPGPGSYHVSERCPTKKAPRAHKFSLVHDRCPQSNLPTDAGYYYPNFGAASRAKPRAAHFGKYSEREPTRHNDYPGPGTYNIGSKPRNIYSSKPSSMFATNANRGADSATDTPGPGTYNIPSLFAMKRPGEVFSAFGSSQARFLHFGSSYPGPGTYAGEIAPRRPKPTENSLAPFSSTAERFADDLIRPSPGPGQYNGAKLPKHMHHGGEAPFGSTVPRFDFREAYQSGEYYNSTGPLRFPQRLPGCPIPLNKPVVDQAQEKSNSGYSAGGEGREFRKPTSTFKTTFGGAAKLTATADASGPGPGSYGVGLSSFVGSFNRSGWSQEPRFPLQGTVHSPGPGEYYHNSTFLKPTFNRTIQLDATWQDKVEE